MSRDIALLLIGAAIALGSSIVTALAQHLLSLRAERIKRRWEKEEKESQAFKKGLIEGSQVQLDLVKRAIGENSTIGLLFRKADVDEPEISDEDAQKVLEAIVAETQEKEKA